MFLIGLLKRIIAFLRGKCLNNEKSEPNMSFFFLEIPHNCVLTKFFN